MNAALILGNLGGPVLVTLVLFILGLVFRGGVGNSFRGSLYAGIGLAGISVIINNTTATLTPAIQQLAERFHTDLTITDVGWGSAGIAFTWPGLAIVIVLIMVINALMILKGLTKTMWTDIWSYWHGQVVGGFVWYLTDSVVMGIIAALIFLVIGSLVGDLTAKRYQEFTGLPGISVPCVVSFMGIFAAPFNKIFDKIPVIRDIDGSPHNIKNRVGVFGELGVMGTLIGIVIGILAGYGYAEVLNLGIQVGVLMVFLSKTVSVLCEGVIPIANSVNEFVEDRFEDKEIYVTVDCAALLGHPSVMASAVLIYPLAVVMAVLLPGNGMIPIASLAVVPYWCGAVAPFFKGNVFRIVTFTLAWMVLVLYVATNMAPLHTAVMARLGLGDPAIVKSSFDMGGDLLGAMIVKIFSLFALI